MTDDERMAAISDARLRAYAQLGDVSDYVLAPLIGPALTGGPEWPTRPAWRLIQRGANVVLASDALSDPWIGTDRPGAGYELEVFLEAPASLVGPTGTPTDVASTWVFAAVSEVSHLLAGHGGARALIDELGTLSVEVAGERFPASLRNAHGRVGMLLGLPARGVPDRIDYGPLGDARLLALTLLMPTELERIVVEGDRTRKVIAEALAASPIGHVSSFDRPAVTA